MTRGYRKGLLPLALCLALSVPGASAQSLSSRLPPTRYRNGEETLRALTPLSAAVRYSIVKVNVDGATVALGTLVETNGLALTKASELKPGKLTCWLASEKEVGAEVVAIDETEDIALVRVLAPGLKPVTWATGSVAIGQWVVTPGIAETPHALGIISALPRKIRARRAYLGIQFDVSSSLPKVEELMEGLGAEKAGLKPGDVIVAVNDQAVTNREQVVEKLLDFRDGQSVNLRVERSGAQLELAVRMMALSSSPSVERLGRLTTEVSQRAEGFDQVIEHDTVLPPWLCGGPLVNLDGQAVGLNIARAGRVTTYALPAGLVKRTLDSLKAKPKQASPPGK